PLLALVMREVRAPRTLLAALIGTGLGLAGAVMQGYLRNPLAEPYLLGVSTGAALAAYLWRLPAFGAALVAISPALGAVSQQAFAFVGALVTIAIVFALAGPRGRIDPLRAILVGVIINSLLGSVYLLLNSIYKDLPGSAGGMAFLVGSIQTNLTTSQKTVAGAIVLVGWIVLMRSAGALNAAALGDDEAQSLGVRVHRLRWIALLAGSLMTAAAVAISGPVAFVGLICPHAARLFVGHDTRKLLPLSAAIGAGLLTLADAFCRWLGADGRLGSVLPVGVVTSLVGGPIFLLLLARGRRHG
ncbi:MAG TPA: iron ABC transporter permease, partial [Tepidisphaeraceae bacterium]|nr:iron ABC transporter permease [Tepidisphaeraceae bacterium]